MERNETVTCPFCGVTRNVRTVDYIDDRGNPRTDIHDPGCLCTLARAAAKPIEVEPSCANCAYCKQGCCENPAVLDRVSAFFKAESLPIRDLSGVCPDHALNIALLESLVTLLPPKANKRFHP